MPATLSVTNQPALFAGRDNTQRMPSTVSTSISETGVVASVSLFVLVRSLSALILLGVLISLSGLTGLINLVGLKTGLAPSITQGD